MSLFRKIIAYVLILCLTINFMGCYTNRVMPIYSAKYPPHSKSKIVKYIKTDGTKHIIQHQYNGRNITTYFKNDTLFILKDSVSINKIPLSDISKVEVKYYDPDKTRKTIKDISIILGSTIFLVAIGYIAVSIAIENALKNMTIPWP